MADPKDSASKAAIPLELLKVEAAFVKRAVTSSSGKRSKGQGAPSYKRDVMYAASKHHLKNTSIAFAGRFCRLMPYQAYKVVVLKQLVAKHQFSSS